MAQNLFEKYGIKEVADVTLYRIERKEETYESQRKISIASVLKGALTKSMVYPLDEDGKGETDGYEAYVFKDADILTHYNYDCDDVVTIKGNGIYLDVDGITAGKVYNVGDAVSAQDATTIVADITADDDSHGAVADDDIINLFQASNIKVSTAIDVASNRSVVDKLAAMFVQGYKVSGVTPIDKTNIVFKGSTANTVTFDEQNLVEYRAHLVAPIEFKGGAIGDLDKFVAEFEALGGEIEYEDNTVTSATLIIGAPFDASGDEIRAYFNMQYDALYKSTGVICRFTQPVRTANSVDSNTFNATITVVSNYVDGQSKTDIVTFKNTVLTSTNAELVQKFIDKESVTSTDVRNLEQLAATDPTITIVSSGEITGTPVFSNAEIEIVEEESYNKFGFAFEVTLAKSDEILTGIYDLAENTLNGGHDAMDADMTVGTHEFSYAEQVCMLFAKNQNLITKAGTRYVFGNADALFGRFEFNDEFATAPNGKERAVVVGLPGRISENLYSIDEVNDAIKELTDSIEAKAYDITYSDYAELLVEDEMGYYLPQQLGYALNKKDGKVSFFSGAGISYEAYAKAQKGVDIGIKSAINTWGDGAHYSINDAIDALKQESKLLDGSAEYSTVGYDRVFGGYEVRGKSIATTDLPLDDIGRGAEYDDYLLNGQRVTDPVTGHGAYSSYALASVLDTLASSVYPNEIGQLRITSTAEIESNRAIYVNPDNGMLANRSFIYLLKNVNRGSLTSDKSGIFEFRDKKGNRLYYQDKVFAGTAYLALVVIGNYGLVFVVNRNCNKNTTQTAWMVNDNGYITDKQAERIVKNGLIHTVTITACDESFDATCTVASIKTRKTKKNVLRYIPVLFLDTLKVSTIEQASESTDATGGKGNAKLITWDYGKEITLSIEDALYTPASMSAIWAGEHGDLKNGVKETTMIDRMEKITAKRSFIVPAGNHEGTPSEGNVNAQAVYYDPKTMEPFQDGTPIAEGEVIYKFTRSVAYEGNSIGNTIEISADKFPGTYRVVGETCVRDKATGKDQRFQFIIPEAKMSAADTAITLEADGDPVVFSFTMDVLRPDNGVMMKFVQFDVVDNEEENDGSTMVKDTENLNLLDSAEMYKVSGDESEELVIGATEY